MIDRVALLRGTALFDRLEVADLERLAEALEEVRFPAGATILREGDPGDSMYVIASGTVSVVVRSEQFGVSYEIARLGPGQHFGEMSLITRERRSAKIVALEDVTAVMLDGATFERIALQFPQVALGVSRALATRLARANRERGIPFVSLRNQRPNQELWSRAPEALWRRARAVPLALDHGLLTVATVDPANLSAIDDLLRATRAAQINVVAVSQEECDRAIAEAFGAAKPPPARPDRKETGRVALPADPVPRYFTASDAQADRGTSDSRDAVALFDRIVVKALLMGASDIHLEADRGGVMLRFRVDGQLRNGDIPIPLTSLRSIISRAKVLAQVDIAETRKPQSGRIALAFGDREYDLRVSTMPARMGEKLAIRILEPAAGIRPLEGLIVAGNLASLVRQALFRPFGAVLVTGPTGSGKTTTLYSCLAERMAHGVPLNVLTAEDPIEYYLPGITQVQIHEAIGLTYTELLRSFLRQDPDIIVVGETRDAAAARMALEGALTGRLVLTTMHTGDALSTLARMREMGLEPFLIASSVICIISQRLVRRLCPLCRRPGEYPEGVLDCLRTAGVIDGHVRPAMWEAAGCDACRGTGFHDRIGIFEVLLVDQDVRDVVARDLPLPELREALDRTGYVRLGRYARDLLEQGLTVPGEVLRAVRTL